MSLESLQLQVAFSAITFIPSISAWSFCCKTGVPAGVCHCLPRYICREFLLLIWSPFCRVLHALLDVLLLLASQLLPFLLLLGSSWFSESMLFWHPPCVLFWKYLNFLTSVLLFCRSHRNQEQFYGSCLCYYTVATISVVKTTST